MTKEQIQVVEMPWVEFEDFLLKFPEYEHVFWETPIAYCDPRNITGKKPPGWFRDKLKVLKKKHGRGTNINTF